MQTTIYQGIKVDTNNTSSTEDILVIEAPLQININNDPYTVVMRTPGNDEELVRGLLFAEDIYKKSGPLASETVESNKTIPTIVNLTISKIDLGKGYLTKRTLLSVSSCGICGKQTLNDIQINTRKLETKIQFDLNRVYSMFKDLQNQQVTFTKTGGSHAAGIFSRNYQLLNVKEDIGRHNAVDKCIGELLLKNQLKSAYFLLVSGRVSYEIISKAFIAKIPVIVAISACSSMAVDYAKELGICLIGFTRNQKMTIYSHPNF